MSDIDLKNYSVAELKVLSERADELIQSKEHTMLSEAFAKITEIAESVGKTVDELAVWGNNQARKRKKVAIRYRDKADPANTWTGRGIKPRWLQDRLNAGAELESFLI